MALEIQILAWDRHKNVAVLNQLMRVQSPLIIGFPMTIYQYTCINKQYKIFTDSLSLKMYYQLVHSTYREIFQVSTVLALYSHHRKILIINLHLHIWLVGKDINSFWSFFLHEKKDTFNNPVGKPCIIIVLIIFSKGMGDHVVKIPDF